MGQPVAHGGPKGAPSGSRASLSSNDLGQIASVRRTIVEGTRERGGAEASYRLGLDALFIRRDLKEAEDYFRRATKAKSPTWSPSARMSLWERASSRGQDSAGHLRAAARRFGLAAHDPFSVQAKGLLALAFHKNRQPKESERVRDECKTSLRAMSDVSPLTPDGALAAWMLGMELKFDGDLWGARACPQRPSTLNSCPPTPRPAQSEH